jgi:hypothetical protein
MLVTKQRIRMIFRGYEITIPEGTRTTHETALGIDEKYNFITDLSWIDKIKYYGMRHEAYYYGINISKELLKLV